MITKERLKELIEQGATVFSIGPGRVINGKPLTIQLSDECEIYNGKLYVSSWECCGDYNMLYLYEHKADAEWELEFGNVEKRIKFVKPKPFREVESVRNQTVYDAHGIEMYIGENNIFICTGFLFEKPFNEENYTEACRLIKKLFMEEE